MINVFEGKMYFRQEYCYQFLQAFLVHFIIINHLLRLRKYLCVLKIKNFYSSIK